MSSLSDVGFQQIKGQYWYGLFGDFKLIIDKQTGLFNASKLCQDGSRKFDNWLKNKSSKELTDTFSSPTILGDNLCSTLIMITGGSGYCSEIIRGTYVREELLLIACWISSNFYKKCYTIVRDYFAKEFTTKYQTDTEAITHKLQEVYQQMQTVRARNAKLEGHIEDISLKINDVQRHMFTIVQKNSPGEQYPWRVMRVQKRQFNGTFKKLRTKYSNAQVIARLDYNPNSISLYNQIKDKIPYIQYKYNDFTLLNVPIKIFVNDVNKILKI